MQTYNKLPDAVDLARFAHRNQFDKAGLPYFDHPLRVLANVQAMGARPFVQMAAILHDVVEDTPFSIDMLRTLGFSEPVLILVDLVTRKDDVPPEAYYAAIKQNQDAAMIKAADIRDNTSEWRLSYLDDKTQTRLRAKYAQALVQIGY